MFGVSYTVERTKVIDAPKEKVWENIILFSKQKIWSPWVIMEPECNTKILGEDGTVGAIDTWNGDVIGAGERENLEIQKESFLRQEIRFTKPFKSKAEVYFSLQEVS